VRVELVINPPGGTVKRCKVRCDASKLNVYSRTKFPRNFARRHDLKLQNYSWIRSVQGAVATWSNDASQNYWESRWLGIETVGNQNG
jgi:hypothetical protein